MRDTDLATKLRRDPVLAPRVVEVAGWQTRGSADFNPRGFLWHHTAGPLNGAAPSLGVCINGRSDLPGPLCNVMLGRDGTVYVVAAGRANHAGAGSWRGLTGNASVYGLEVENVGTPAEPWQPFILDAAARIAAATGVDHENCAMHKEWAPTRKIDMHTITGRDMRARVAQLRQQPSPTPPPPTKRPTEVSMFLICEGVGLFAVVDGVPVKFATPAEYGAARDASPGVPIMALKGAQAKQMIDLLTRRLNASVA